MGSSYQMRKSETCSLEKTRRRVKMKKSIALFLIAGLVFSISALALAEENIEESTKFIEVLASELKTMLDANRVLGTPIEFEGTRIIPVVSYGFGFGGGSGIGADEMGQGGGTGGGAGGGIMPMSLLIITKDGDVKVVAAKKGEFGEVMKALAPMVMEAIKSGQAQQPETPEGTPPAEEEKTE